MNNYPLPQPEITDVHRRATKDNRGGRLLSEVKRGMHAIDPRCVTCGLPTWIDVMPEGMTPGDEASLGHIIPASWITPDAKTNGARGGYTTDMLLLQCGDCNGGMGATPILFVEYIPSYLGAARFPRLPKPETATRADVKREVRRARGLAA